MMGIQQCAIVMMIGEKNSQHFAGALIEAVRAQSRPTAVVRRDEGNSEQVWGTGRGCFLIEHLHMHVVTQN
jgi:hypothetical protein